MRASRLTRKVFKGSQSPGLWSWGVGYMDEQRGDYEYSDHTCKSRSMSPWMLGEKRHSIVEALQISNRYDMRRIGE